MDLSGALTQFDRTIANLELLEGHWEKYQQHIPDSPAFGLDTPEVEQIRRDYTDTANSLPAIDGYRIDSDLWALDDISQAILDYQEIGEALAGLRFIDEIEQNPKRQIDKYRYIFTKARRNLVRRRVEEIVTEVDDLLRLTVASEQGREFSKDEEGWSSLRGLITELHRLLGKSRLPGTRIADLYRHIHFAQPCDLHDIVVTDWPSVRTGLIDLVFEGEPLTVDVEDIGELVKSEPTGSVTSSLEWDQLDSTTFERLIFDIIRSADTYQNVQWLMKTNAPDRGRDISAEKVIVDPLSGIERCHVVFQCKHWQSKSIAVSDLSVLPEQVKLWSRRFVEVTIVTSGTFTQDAVEWREKREIENAFPKVTFWSGSHLERLLAERPAIRSSYF